MGYLTSVFLIFLDRTKTCHHHTPLIFVFNYLENFCLTQYYQNNMKSLQDNSLHYLKPQSTHVLKNNAFFLKNVAMYIL